MWIGDGWGFHIFYFFCSVFLISLSWRLYLYSFFAIFKAWIWKDDGWFLSVFVFELSSVKSKLLFWKVPLENILTYSPEKGVQKGVILRESINYWMTFWYLSIFKDCCLAVTFFFFLSGFSFPTIHESQDCSWRGRAYFNYTLPFLPTSQTLKH